MSRLVIAAVLLVATATSAAETTSAAAAAVDNYTECDGYSLSCSDCVKKDTKQYKQCDSSEYWVWACSDSTPQQCRNGTNETKKATTDGNCISVDGDRVMYVKVTEDTYTEYYSENCTDTEERTPVKLTDQDGKCHKASGEHAPAYSVSGDKTKLKLTVYSGYSTDSDGTLTCDSIQFVGTFDTENDKEKCHVLRKYITDSTCGVVESTTKETSKGAAAASVWALAAALAAVAYVSF